MEKICADLNPDAVLIKEPAAAFKKEIVQKALNVLVADDSNMARKMISGVLEKAGFKVESVENGEIAWVYLQNIKRKAMEHNMPLQDYVDIVVSDIEMPAMDGHSLTRHIKEDPVLKALPVVLCSSIITETLHHKGIAVGADDQVSKAELGDLVPRVFELINREVVLES